MKNSGRVQGKLPKEVVKASDVLCNSRLQSVPHIAIRSAEILRSAACKKAKAACDQTWAAWLKANADYEKAIQKHLPEIEALHKKECPNCTWNGKEIVF